jgi:dTDP-4-amino-4,6-dideoxygalactose transaminase
MESKIPLIDLEAQLAPIRDEILEAITRCVDSQHYILGEEVTAFEDAVAAYCDVEHAVGVSSGTDALLMSLMALGVGPGDEVVTTAYSFFATAGVVARLGATPVFVDIEPDTFNIDPAQIDKAITPNTKVLMPVHLYGQLADMDAMTGRAENRGIALVEDAAQAIGADGAVGRGVIGCFSFYPTKNLSAMGEAGMVVTRDADRARALRLLRNHGAATTYFHDVVGGNFRMDAVQAAVLNVKLRHLDAWNAKRRDNARRYDELFSESGLVESGRVQIPSARRDHVYHQYVIRIDERDAAQRRLADAGVASGIYYPVPLPLQPCFAHLGHGPGDFPEAERASRQTLALPIFPELSEKQQRRVVSILAT